MVVRLRNFSSEQDPLQLIRKELKMTNISS